MLAPRSSPFRLRLARLGAALGMSRTPTTAQGTGLAQVDTSAVALALMPAVTQSVEFKALVVVSVIAFLLAVHLYRLRLATRRQRQLELAVEERMQELRAEKENVETQKTRAEIAWDRAETAWARAEGAKAIIEAQSEELVQANEALRHVNSQLAETSEVKSHLMRVVAHDLNNPLGVILGYTDVLREVTDPDGEAHELIQIIEGAAGDMMALVQRFLGAEAIDDGRLALHTRPIDLSALVRSSAERFQPSAARKDQTLIIEADEPVHVNADRDWLKEVLDNLISNAVKYTPPERCIWVRVVPTGEARVQVRVRDEGPGLTDEDKAKLFGRFQRLSAKPTGNESSTGLGLSIVKKIVEMHGGTVWAESVYGEGTTFIAEFDALTEEALAEV
ncbi:MAG: HAMP domain-containing sensor histidine kinase [Bacteroidota bacterium]